MPNYRLPAKVYLAILIVCLACGYLFLGTLGCLGWEQTSVDSVRFILGIAVVARALATLLDPYR